MSDENQALSKNVIYAPLSSYTDTPPTPVSKETPEQSSLLDDPTNSKTRLYSVLINISKKYHGHVPSKVLRENMLDARLMQRALTLVGGGINNSLNATNKNNRKRKREHALSNNNRKKKQQQHVLANPSNSNDEKEFTPTNNKKNGIYNLPRTLETQEVLSTINKMWNDHVQRNIINWNCYDIKQLSTKLANIEVGGAYMRIVSSNNIHPKLIGQNGIILEESKNTWMIALTDYYCNTTASKKKKYDEEIQVIRVPKVGTSLAFRLKTDMLHNRKEDDSKLNGDNNDIKDFCIIINGPDSNKKQNK